jgi:hypothetical protein
MSVKLKTPSNGSVTLAPEDTGSDVVLTVPAVAGEILNDQSDIETQVKTATNATGSAPIYACRAWVNFNGTGTVAIRASGNVSSITDNGVGEYTVNFATAMPDANYCASVNHSERNNFVSGMYFDQDGTLGTFVGSFRFITSFSSANIDPTNVFVAIFR